MKNLIKCMAVFDLAVLSLSSCQRHWEKKLDSSDKINYYHNSRSWTRWWWFASQIDNAAIATNLKWLKDNGFGGVEIAWVYPLNRMNRDTVNYIPRQERLSREWTEVVRCAKTCADSAGLRCDFTFGTLYPFGDSRVSYEEGKRNLINPNRRQEISASWECPKESLVINHLSRKAFYHYAGRVGMALAPALKGSKSALFWDSCEVETRFLRIPGFEEAFF